MLIFMPFVVTKLVQLFTIKNMKLLKVCLHCLGVRMISSKP